MSVENPLWGAPRIHGELLKLGFEVAQSRPKNEQILQNRRQNRLAKFGQVLERAKGIEPSYAAWEDES
jgi:hypothetical protein